MSHYDKFAAYYDAMYSDRKEDVEFYVSMAQEVDAPVLECGCGTGRILIPLVQSGLDVWGVDSSNAMLDILRSKAQQAESFYEIDFLGNNFVK